MHNIPYQYMFKQGIIVCNCFVDSVIWICCGITLAWSVEKHMLYLLGLIRCAPVLFASCGCLLAEFMAFCPVCLSDCRSRYIRSNQLHISSYHMSPCI